MLSSSRTDADASFGTGFSAGPPWASPPGCPGSSPDNRRPMSDTPQIPEPDEGGRVEDFFRDQSVPQEALLWWQLDRHEALLAAQRALFHGPAALVRLRLWVFLEILGLTESRLTRETLNRHFHVLKDEALELVLKRLREAELLAWDASAQTYAVTPLAQQLVGMLAPFTQGPAADGDLASLLAGVAGAHQLGTLQPAQLQHLLAQLARLYDEFADAIASGSEFALRRARERFEKALTLVDRASEALGAIMVQAEEAGEARLERLARELGLAQARLLAMASQFNRALQQADRQRVTLGSTGITTTDVRRWLQHQPDLAALLDGLWERPVHPVLVSQHELFDMAEGEFERVRPVAAEPGALPAGMAAPPGELGVMELPPEMAQMRALLDTWRAAGEMQQDLAPAVLGGSYARSAYRAQLLPLLGDKQAQHLKGATGDMARQPWRVRWSAEQGEVNDPHVAWMSRGLLIQSDNHE